MKYLVICVSKEDERTWLLGPYPTEKKAWEEMRKDVKTVISEWEESEKEDGVEFDEDKLDYVIWDDCTAHAEYKDTRFFWNMHIVQ